MKTTLLFSIILATSIFFSCPANSQNKETTTYAPQTYESMWEEVEKAHNNDFPKKVINIATEILFKAQKEKNFSQVMKAWTEIVRQKRDLSPDSMKVVTLPDYPHSVTNDIAANAILASDGKDTDRSELYDSICEAIKQNKEVLFKTKISDYYPIAENGNDSAIFNKDMLSIMTFYVAENINISNESVISLFDDVSRFYLDKGNKAAWAILRAFMFKQLSCMGKIDAQTHLDSITWIRNEVKDSRAIGEIEELYLNKIKNKIDPFQIGGAVVFQEKNTNRNKLLEETDKLLEMIRQAKIKYPEYAANFQNMYNSFYAPTCKITNISTIDYKHPFVYKLEYYNSDKAKIEIRQFNGYNMRGDLKTSGKLMFKRDYTLGTDDFNKERKTKNLPTIGELTDSVKLPIGRYVYILKSNGEESVTRLFTPSIQLTSISLPNNKTIVSVTDIISGKPVKDATVVLIRTNINSNAETIIDNFSTDNNGMAEISVSNDNQYRYSLYAKLSNDNRTEEIALPYYFDNRNSTKNRLENENNYIVLTDRPVYRPGQTAHLSMISFCQHGDNIRVNENQQCTITFSNYQKKINTLNIVTNSLGNATCDLNIPKDLEPGTYNIIVNGKYVSHISIEEYKRPTFFVETDGARTINQTSTEEKEASFSFGDTINVEISANTFSGIPVQNSNVKYKIYTGVRKFGSRAKRATQLLSEGITKTNGKGKAYIPFILEKKNLNAEIALFRVEYTVTDQAGESHDGEYNTAVSDKAFYFSFPAVKNTLDLSDNPEITLKALNGNDNEVDAEEVINPRYFLLHTDSSVVYEQEWKVGEKIKLQPVAYGDYILKAIANDKKGNTIIRCCNLALFSSRQLGEKSYFSNPLFFSKTSEVSTSSPATIYFAPAHDSTTVYTLVYANNGQYYHKLSQNIGKKVEKFEIPFKEEYSDAMTVFIYYVKNSKTFYKKFSFTKKEPCKDLTISWKTFRDKLTPGQKEKWTLSIKDKNGKAVNGADLVATLYDSSLDQIATMSWDRKYFNFRRNIPITYIEMSSKPIDFSCDASKPMLWSLPFKRIYGDINCSLSRLKYRNFDMTSEDCEIFEGDEALQVRVAGLNIVSNSKIMRLRRNTKAMAAKSMNTIAESIEIEEEENGSEAPAVSVPPVNIRKDFSETAFFFPSLISNKEGEVDVEFNLPETLTEWHFMGFVHTSEMENATISAKAVARQAFMVKPNMPRFIREDDKASITALIINQSEEDLSGNAYIRILDAETEEVLFTSQQPFSVSKDNTEAVTFSLKEIKSKEAPYICEISATSGSISDGERNRLIILPSDQKLYETVPFFFESEKEKSIDLASLFNNHSNTTHDKHLSLSYTPNPALLVVDALENIKVSTDDNAPSFAASLYANSMLKNLAELVPDYKKEHPAYSEDSTDFYLRLAEDKLSELQNQNGSFSWYKGMIGNYYMTLAVCEHLALLSAQQMAVFDTDAGNGHTHSMLNANTQRMLDAALNFLDETEVKFYKSLKKSTKKKYIHPYESTVHYLHILTLLPDRHINGSVKNMIDTYLKTFAEDSQDLTIYGKAQGAEILRHFNKTKPADDFVQSIIEYSVTKPGMGRYFDTRKAYYSWRDYKIPTQIAAMKAIAGTPGNNTDKMLNEMTVWLFRQKQVQKWDNPINTVEVADYLLKSNSSSLSSGYSIPVAFSLDGKDINVGDTVKVDKVNNLYITRLSDDNRPNSRVPKISWGAVSGSFYEKTTNIKANSVEGLNIDYQILDKNGKPIKTAKVGDKVTIRVTVTADRDMDFVKVNVQHPGCFEHVNQTTGYRKIGYVVIHDSSTDINRDTFTKGTHKFDLDYYVERPGKYTCGIATAICTYCPDFSAHSSAHTITIEK